MCHIMNRRHLFFTALGVGIFIPYVANYLFFLDSSNFTSLMDFLKSIIFIQIFNAPASMLIASSFFMSRVVGCIVSIPTYSFMFYEYYLISISTSSTAAIGFLVIPIYAIMLALLLITISYFAMQIFCKLKNKKR